MVTSRAQQANVGDEVEKASAPKLEKAAAAGRMESEPVDQSEDLGGTGTIVFQGLYGNIL